MHEISESMPLINDQPQIPEVDWTLTTSRVLTMEFCKGGQVNDRNYMVEHGIDTKEVSEKIGKLYSEMIFVNGYVHCDPHPGNVLVEKVGNSAQIVLLDHGLYTVSLTHVFNVLFMVIKFILIVMYW